jgi:hypothetical protein
MDEASPQGGLEAAFSWLAQSPRHTWVSICAVRTGCSGFFCSRHMKLSQMCFAQTGLQVRRLTSSTVLFLKFLANRLGGTENIWTAGVCSAWGGGSAHCCYGPLLTALMREKSIFADALEATKAFRSPRHPGFQDSSSPNDPGLQTYKASCPPRPPVCQYLLSSNAPKTSRPPGHQGF